MNSIKQRTIAFCVIAIAVVVLLLFASASPVTIHQTYAWGGWSGGGCGGCGGGGCGGCCGFGGCWANLW